MSIFLNVKQFRHLITHGKMEEYERNGIGEIINTKEDNF